MRGLGWGVGVGIATMAGIGLVLLFLLTQATNNRELYERNYALLFGLNVFVVRGVAGDVALRTVFAGVIPFLVAMIATLFLIIAFPQIALTIPNSMFGG